MTYIRPQGKSSGNSSTVPLAGGATFTGTAEVNGHPDVGVSCFADAAGTLFFDFSNDGTTWRTFPVAGFAVAAGIHEFHTAVKLGRYFRVRLVNGSAAQSTLDMAVYYGNYAKIPNSPLNQSLGADSDAILVRPAADFGYEVTRGQVSGYGTIAKFGRNPDLDTGDLPEDVWNGGSAYTGHPLGEPSAIAETVEVFSSDTSDTSAGTGARTLTMVGLDENGDEQTDTVTLNGTTPVATTSLWYRLNRGYVVTAGSSEENEGDITIRHTTTTANVFAVLPALFGQTQINAWTVPAGKQAVVRSRSVGVTNNQGSAQEIVSCFAQRPYGSSAWRRRRPLVASTVGGESVDSIDFGILLGPLDDVVERVVSSTASNLVVTARFNAMFF